MSDLSSDNYPLSGEVGDLSSELLYNGVLNWGELSWLLSAFSGDVLDLDGSSDDLSGVLDLLFLNDGSSLGCSGLLDDDLVVSECHSSLCLGDGDLFPGGKSKLV